jgi:hypothetical protein
MDSSLIKSYLEIARQYGVTYMKVGELEFNLGVEPSVQVPQDLVPKNVELSDEDMLFYSVEAPKKSE